MGYPDSSAHQRLTMFLLGLLSTAQNGRVSSFSSCPLSGKPTSDISPCVCTTLCPNPKTITQAISLLPPYLTPSSSFISNSETCSVHQVEIFMAVIFLFF
uniref:Secreted protein n=1 Tax=Cacopsylla melanoneura TaxID=428564 RepID=A0A8D8WSF0_9HEMI